MSNSLYGGIIRDKSLSGVASPQVLQVCFKKGQRIGSAEIPAVVLAQNYR